MSQYQQILQLRTRGKAFHNITQEIRNVVKDSGICNGLCSLFMRHTSASFVIQENADPDVLKDLETFLSRLIPEQGQGFLHTTEGSDDMPAHIRTALTHTSEQIPISKGELLLGTWQGIYLWEHRSHGRIRETVVHVLGE